MSFLGLNWKDVAVGAAGLIGNVVGEVVPVVGPVVMGAALSGLVGGAIAWGSTGSFEKGLETGLGDAALGALPGSLLGRGAGTLLDKFGINAASKVGGYLIGDTALQGLGAGALSAYVNHMFGDSNPAPAPPSQLPVRIITPSSSSSSVSA